MTTETPSLTPDQFTAERQSAVERLQKHYERIFDKSYQHRSLKAVIVNGVRFASAREASIATNIPEQAINRSCRNGGRAWRYQKVDGKTYTVHEFNARWAK